MVALVKTPVNFKPQMLSALDILDLFQDRQSSRAVDIQRMRKMQAVMNNDLKLPVPELKSDERPAVANLMQQGMRQLAMRIASVTASIYFPSLDPADPQANDDANNRHRLIQAWRTENRENLITARRARHLLTYAECPVVVKPAPSVSKPIPVWQVQNPMECYPSDTQFNDYLPRDCILVHHNSLGWLSKYFKDQTSRIYKGTNFNGANPDMDQLFTVLTYISAAQITMVLIGQEDSSAQSYAIPATPGSQAQVLAHTENLTGCPFVVIPNAINLDKKIGFFDGIVGMYEAQAVLMALGLVAQRRSLWPREWAESRPNEQVTIRTIPDPYNGIPGEVDGGVITQQKLDPSFQAFEYMDRLTEAEQRSAGLPSEFGGFSNTNIRTGRRGSQVMGATVDYTISESQDILAHSAEVENYIAIEIDKAYYNKRKSYYIASRSFAGSVTYTPSNLWKTSAHIVEYPIAGVDLQNLPVEGGQRVQMGVWSRERFMEVDPGTPDAKAEKKRILGESIQQIQLQSIMAEATNPQMQGMTSIDLNSLYKHIMGDVDFSVAIDKVHAEAQQRQATAAESAMAPEAQPGITQPGAGGAQPPPPIQNQANMQDFTQLLRQAATFRAANRA